MRLRHVSAGSDHIIRSQYDHEEAAAAAGFELVWREDGDLAALAQQGYQHRRTKNNATLGHHGAVRTWRWRDGRAPPAADCSSEKS